MSSTRMVSRFPLTVFIVSYICLSLVKKMFAKNWHEKKHKLPTIAKIYLITCTAYQRSSFEKYRYVDTIAQDSSLTTFVARGWLRCARLQKENRRRSNASARRDVLVTLATRSHTGCAGSSTVDSALPSGLHSKRAWTINARW